MGKIVDYLRSLHAAEVARKRAQEAARRATLDQFRRIVETAHEGIWLVDGRACTTYINGRMAEMLGYSACDLIGRSIFDFIDERSQAIAREYFEGRRQGSIEHDFRFQHRDGTRLWALVATSPMLGRDDEFLGAIGMVTDITERKRAEQQQALQYAIAGVLAGASTLDEAAPQLLQILCETLGWEMGEIWTVDREANLLRFTESWHASSLEVSEFLAGTRGANFALGSGLPGKVWESGQPAWETDVTGATDFQRIALAARAGLHGAFGFPIIIGGQILGVMVLFSRERRLPEEDLLPLLSIIGSQIGQFIERKIAEEELQATHERFRALVERSMDSIAVFDSLGRVAYVSPAVIRDFGYSYEELMAADVLAANHPDQAAVRKIFADLMERPNAPRCFHLRGRRRDGTMCWIEGLATNLLADPSVRGIVVNFHDITERKRSEEALQRSEDRYRRLIELSPDGIGLLDNGGKIVFLNAAGAMLVAAAPQEVIGRPLFDLVHPDDREAIDQRVRESVADVKTALPIEGRLIRLDGSIVEVEVATVPSTYQGEPATQVMLRDITERKRAQAEIEAGRERIAAILRSVPDALVVTDLADRVILMNHAAEALLGSSAASSRHVEGVLEEDLTRQIVSVRKGEQETSIMELERQGDGSSPGRILQAKTTALRSADGRLTGTITILRDVTREREIDRMKDEFISTAAHELRTPLTAVMGYSELLLQEDQAFSRQQQHEFLALVYEKAEVLEQIISDLLDLSIVRAGRLITLKKSREDLAALVARTIATYQGTTDRHTFPLEFPTTAVDLCFDPEKIGQVLQNLLSNAVKFSPGGGPIRVRGERTDGEFEITVEDHGIGMQREQVTRVFDKFYRADASDTAVGGLGLGMSIVRNIVEAHGGRIWVESEPGEGTRVHFTLPLGGSCEESAPPLH